MKKVSSIISYVLHPLIMPSLGLLIILNSGTYLSLLDPAVKRAILFVMVLGTFIFPLMMFPILQYRHLVRKSGQLPTQEERLITQGIILILYLITFIYFKKLPLSHVIHAYTLSVTATLFLLLILNLRFHVSMHTTAFGNATGLIITLIYLYNTPLLGLLILTLLAGGIAGSSRMALGEHWGAILRGFLLGLIVVTLTLLVY